MIQNLTTSPISQMPNITSPNPLDTEVMAKLAANRLNLAANTFVKPQLVNIKLHGLAVLCRHRKLKPLTLKKFLSKRLGKISSVSQKQTPVAMGQFSNHMNVIDAGWGQIESLNHADRVDFYMKSKTIKNLITKLFAIAGLALKKLAISCSG